MLHFYKFREELFGPVPAAEVYVKRGPGRGWPEECPPIRAANGFGFDLLANFDVTFTRRRDGTWRIEPDTVIESDFDWSPGEEVAGAPLVQQYAWAWDKGQLVPHKISDNVYETIKNQVKVSSFLFLKTDANELLYMTDIPNLGSPVARDDGAGRYRLVPGQLPMACGAGTRIRARKKITIKRGTPTLPASCRCDATPISPSRCRPRRI